MKLQITIVQDKKKYPYGLKIDFKAALLKETGGCVVIQHLPKEDTQEWLPMCAGNKICITEQVCSFSLSTWHLFFCEHVD